MLTATLTARPLFELHGRAGRIDLSAWISGISYSLGVFLAGGGKIASAIASGSSLLWLLPASYVLFLASVLLIQRHMRLSMLASTFGAPRRLVTSGIFKYSRNPIYVAFLIPLASLAVISAAAALAAAAFYILVMNLTIIRTEERDLRQFFGDDFSSYAAATPRWLF